MENNIKRFLSLVVALVMVFGMLPMGVFAAEAEADKPAPITVYFDNTYAQWEEVYIYVWVRNVNDTMGWFEPTSTDGNLYAFEIGGSAYQIKFSSLENGGQGHPQTAILEAKAGKIYTYGAPEITYAAEVNGTKYETLKEAVAAANAIEGGATVTMLADVTLGEKLTITGDVTIKGAHTITRDDAYTGTFFTVNAGATLTLDNGLVIDGGNEWTFDFKTYDYQLNNMIQVGVSRYSTSDPEEQKQIIADNSLKAKQYFTLEEGAPVATGYMITTNGGTVNLNDITIQNGYSINSGVVSAGANSTITLTGAEIKHMASVENSGVVANVSGQNILVTVNEGTVIDGNHVGGNHGIFKIYSGAVLTMNGGEIKNTTGWNSNGIAVGLFGGTFNMNGGVICNNTSVYGPDNGRNAAIYLHSNSVMNMSGGTICHNSGRSRGGIDSSKSSSTLNITDGTVVYNESIAGNYNYDVGGTVGTWSITGGWYTQDVTEFCAPGYCAVIDYHEGYEDELWHVVPAVAYNVNRDLYYADLSYALSVAVADETVQLLRETYEDLVLVPAGVTFDLNGNVVETKNTLSFGVIIDNQEDMTKIGGIKIPFDTAEAFTKLQPGNGYLPVYDDRDGVGMYKFFSYEVQSNKQVGSGSQIIYAARVVFDNNAAYEVLANSGDSGVDFVMNMSWTNVTDFDIRFTMSESILKSYAQSAYDQLASGAENTKAMTLTIKGINKLGSGAFIEATPSVQTVAEVNASSNLMHYDIP